MSYPANEIVLKMMSVNFDGNITQTSGTTI